MMMCHILIWSRCIGWQFSMVRAHGIIFVISNEYDEPSWPHSIIRFISRGIAIPSFTFIQVHRELGTLAFIQSPRHRPRINRGRKRRIFLLGWRMSAYKYTCTCACITVLPKLRIRVQTLNNLGFSSESVPISHSTSSPAQYWVSEYNKNRL